MTLGDLKRRVDAAVSAYGGSAQFVTRSEDENSPVIEVDIHPSNDSNKTGAPVVINFNTTEIKENEW